MRCIFRDNIPLAQFVLRILTGKDDLQVTDLETQKDFKRLVGARSVCLDAYATDSSGKKFDLEIQRSDLGAGTHRARYHSSAMDIENLDAGQDFDELPDTYTIFITEHDVLNQSLPYYQIERVTLHDGKPFQDGSHILYINGEYRGDTPLGKLMHDFSCWDPDDMNYALMEEAARY
ncbi:MAG: PD-(D/E)XK nuclease family transposase, partial [Oscillospiraceae bacterium]|nr:PD-(D/E)XK nuclease family transposase [Oscillospiraceae bacterium]